MRNWFICGVLLVLLVSVHSAVLGKSVDGHGSRATPVVTPDQFRQALIREFRQHYGLEQVELAVRVLFPKKPIGIPSGNLTMQLVENPQGVRTGRRAFRFRLHVDSQFIQTANIVAEIGAKTQLVTPLRWIKTSEIIQAKDLSVMKVALPSLSDVFIQDPSLAVGKKALRPIPPNQPIRQAFLAAPPVIRKGDRVIIEVRQGGMIVQTVGLAKASGIPGQTIPVKNQTSGREVLGTILSAGLVEVSF